jgi:Na+/H+ antiporter NhaD/arsenite permease-like protein
MTPLPRPGVVLTSLALHMPHDILPTTDAVSQALVGVTIIALFLLLTREAAHRVLVAIGATAILWGLTYLTPYHLIPFDLAFHHIDLNVLLLLAAMMALVGVLKDTGVFGWGVARLIHLTRGRPFVVQALLIWLTAVLSAGLDNVTTVIFVTPMAIAMARQMQVPAAAFLLPVVMASNVGGTATLIGDPPNIIIASSAQIPFVAFLVNIAAPVLVMVFLTEWVSARYYRSVLAAPRGAFVPPDIPKIDNPRLLRWASVVMVGVFVGFLTQRMTGMPPAVPAVMGAAAAMAIQDYLYLRTHKPSAHERRHGILRVFEFDIEWPTLAFFAFLFIVVGAAVETGLIGRVATSLSNGIHAGSATLGLGEKGTLLFAAVLICWVSGVLSAFIDNIPFVAVSIPIVHQLGGELKGDPMTLWWALALGACLGGNGTAVGASANVTVTGMAEKAGEPIAFNAFARFGAPFAALTVLVSSLYLSVFVFGGARIAYTVFLLIAGALGAVRLLRGWRGNR